MLAKKVLAVLTLTVAATANPMEKRNGCDVNHPVQACCDGFLNCIVVGGICVQPNACCEQNGDGILNFCVAI